MRLSGLEGSPGAPEPEGPRPAGFGGALRQAEAQRAARGLAGQRDGELARQRAREERSSSARGRRATPPETSRARLPAGRRDGIAAQGAASVPGAEAGGTGSGGAIAAGAAPGRAQGPEGPGPGGAVTLALAARAVVPAVEAFRRSGREALSLDFGPALGVEVRVQGGGVALTLAAAPGLAAAARAELPNLVRALAGRGVSVVHAEVRPRSAGEPSRSRRGR